MAHFFSTMSRQFEQERALQASVETLLHRDMPDVEVLDVEFDPARETLRIFIDSPAGVSHELCSNVTKIVHEVHSDYALEVSSPGIERPLRHRHHFEVARGNDVKIRVRGSRRPFTGTIVDVDDEAVTVRRALAAEEIVDERVLFANIARSSWSQTTEPAGQLADTLRRQR